MKYCLITLISLSLATTCQSQTLDITFYKKSNPKKTFSIVLNDFRIPLRVKPMKGRRIYGILSGYNDSVLIIKGAKNDKETRQKIADLYQGHYFNIKGLREKADSIYYSDIIQIKYSDIKRILVMPKEKPGKRWVVGVVLIAEVLAVEAGYSIFLVNSKNIIIPYEGSLIAIFGIDYFLFTKTINFKNWAVQKAK